ncbi:hypothetical protein [Pararhizobium antarcticum]|nr:hypothetical protein [Pararhizobium antarcticum]
MTKATEAVLDVLRKIDATPEKPIGLYVIGIPLIVEAEEKLTEDEILSAIFWLQSEKVIELLGDNTLSLVRSLSQNIPRR